MNLSIPIHKTGLPFFTEAWKPKFTLGIYAFPLSYALNIFGLWIKLPGKPKDNPDDRAWAISYVGQENGLILKWGDKSKVFWMPWDYMRFKCDVMTNEATWGALIQEPHPHFKKMLDRGEFKDDRMMHEAPFNYLTTKGEVQSTKAVFYVTRSFFKWRIGFGPTKVTHEINVTFKNPIGEGVGTWMGGKRGFTFEMSKEDETPFHTLHRANMTKVF